MNQSDQYLHYMQLMNQIVREMKEIPELPSELPKDVSTLLKVEFPEAGGVLTTMEGHEFPYRGFPFYEFVDKIDLIKKLTRSSLSGLYHEMKNHKLRLLTLLPSLWIFKVQFRMFLFTFYRVIERFRIKSIRYSDAVREIHRALNVGEDSEFRQQLRDTLCMILEFDNAYRFRFQDIIEELDKHNAEKRVEFEIVRLLTIMQSREKGQTIKDTWHLLKWFVWGYMKFDRKLRKIIRDFLLEVDIEKAKLTREDKWFCSGRPDYTMRFVSDPRTNDEKYILELSELAIQLRESVASFRIQTTDELNTLSAKEGVTEEEKQKYSDERMQLFSELLKRYEKNREALRQKYGSH